VVGALLAAVLAGCGADDARDDALVVWTLETQTDRVRTTEAIVAGFTERTGVEVRLVAVDENQFSQLMMSAAAAGTLPDVIGALPLSATWQMAGNELLDTAAHREVLDALDPATFSERALRLVRDGDEQLAVPSDAWAQLLFYRKDLFAEAGLPEPDTYDRVLAAAGSLRDGDRYGITMATAAGDAGTAQAFEGLALGNGCDLVGDDGAVALDGPRCTAVFEFVAALNRSAPPGVQDVDSTRATYFAGRSAMLVWSSFLLDELGGLRQDALPACPECEADPEFLARNTGVVGALSGPGGEPAQFGELTSWTIPVQARRSQAVEFVKYMMDDDAYLAWLGMAPEGKIPVRRGTAAEPDRFRLAWDSLPAGVDSKRPLNEVYPAEVVRELRDGPERFRRWGFERGQGVLMGAAQGELPVPRAVDAMVGGTPPDEAARQAADDVRSIQTSLGG
jgi:multiple sugar transport system substrate-binding protein